MIVRVRPRGTFRRRNVPRPLHRESPVDRAREWADAEPSFVPRGPKLFRSPRFQGDPVLDDVLNGRRLLRRGSRGDAVRKAQQALLDLGYALPRFGADGIFGSETAAAVRRFQIQKRRTDPAMLVDEIIGPQTMEKLDLAFGAEPPGPRPGHDRDILLPHPVFGYLRFGQPRHGSDPAVASTFFGREIERLTPTTAEHGVDAPDARVIVRGTLAVPFRFICRLDLDFGPDPDDPAGRRNINASGTGTLISRRHVLTVGHNLRFHQLFGSAGTPIPTRHVTTVTVSPAQDRCARRAANRQPVAPIVVAGANARVSPGWAASVGDPRFDFGLVTLPTPVPTTFGFWGTERTRLRAAAKASLTAAASLRTAGYPGDKCLDQPPTGSLPAAAAATCAVADRAGCQWFARGRGRTGGPPELIRFTMDAIGGQSGSPVWLEVGDPPARLLVAILEGAAAPGAADPHPDNHGVIINDGGPGTVLGFVRAQMAADGVTPTF